MIIIIILIFIIIIVVIIIVVAVDTVVVIFITIFINCYFLFKQHANGLKKRIFMNLKKPYISIS